MLVNDLSVAVVLVPVTLSSVYIRIIACNSAPLRYTSKSVLYTCERKFWTAVIVASCSYIATHLQQKLDSCYHATGCSKLVMNSSKCAVLHFLFLFHFIDEWAPSWPGIIVHTNITWLEAVNLVLKPINHYSSFSQHPSSYSIVCICGDHN